MTLCENFMYHCAALHWACCQLLSFYVGPRGEAQLASSWLATTCLSFGTRLQRCVTKTILRVHACHAVPLCIIKFGP